MTVFFDTFSGGDSNPIGGNWTTAPGRQAMQVYQSVARPTYNGFSDDSAAYVNSFTPTNDQYAQITVGYNGAGQGSGGPAVRMSTSAASFYGLTADPATGTTLDLYKYVAGTITNIGSVAYTWVAGDILQLAASGTSLYCYVNGVQVLLVTDTDLTSGQVGLWAQNDNIKLDDFAGGDASGSPYTLTATTPQTFTLTGVDATLSASQAARTMTAVATSFAVTDTTKTGYYVLRTYDVYWDDISAETGYRVKWGFQSGGPYIYSTDVGADVTTAAIPYLIEQNPGLSPRFTYYWVVMGLSGTVEGLASAEQVFTVGIGPVAAVTGTFTETGVAANLQHGYTIAAVKGTYVLTGVTANLGYTLGSPYTLTADLTPYFLTGVAATLSVGKNVILALPGAFTLSGINAGLVYSGANKQVGGPAIKMRVGSYMMNVKRNSTILREEKHDRDTINIKVSTAPQVTKTLIKFNYDAE